MDLRGYLESIRHKTVSVVGIGVSNTPLIRMLCAEHIEVVARDKAPREKFGPLAGELEALGARLRLGEDYLEDLNEDIIFRSPGIRPDRPEFVAAEARGAVLTSEMEVFFDVCPCRILAVTGSDGKTTTTTILSELLKAEGFRVYLGGNIGTPLLDRAGEMGPSDLVVLELSSFQLMRMRKSPQTAIITNLAPNHLDIHRDMQEYVDAKRNIFLHQGGADRLVLNADNELTAAMGDEAAGEVLFFSRQHRPWNGVFLDDGTIYEARNGRYAPIMEADRIVLPGVHNIENYMAAFAAARGLVRRETMERVARSFQGVEHRIELVRTLRGVRYYNDSIASSPSRTTAGLRSFREKVILIAGGKDKGVPFDPLGPEIVGHVKKLVLTGMTAEKIRAAVERAPGYAAGSPEIFLVDDFDEAIRTAAELAGDGDVVLLSPASTSFDRFKNFMERGDRFKAVVMGLE